MEAASKKTTLIRQYIATRLESLGALAGSNLKESLLMQNGAYCGHRFRRDDLQAVWFVDEDQIKFFHADGSLADKILASEVEQFSSMHRQAA